MTPSTPFQSLILAAGMGTRMRSDTIKVLHPLLGTPLLGHVTQAALAAGSRQIIPILGHQRERVEAWLNAQPYADQIRVAVQNEQLGTAHAVACALDALDPDLPYTLILSGDVPNLDAQTLRDFINAAAASGCDLAVMTAILKDPASYGRIIRSTNGHLSAIVEYKDASEDQRLITEINAGIYLARTSFLREAIPAIMEAGTNNAQNEYYLTDLVALAARKEQARAWPVPTPELIQGVNDRLDLARATAYVRTRTLERWMKAGVTLIDPARTLIEPTATLEPDVVLEPDVSICGTSHIASGAYIEQGCRITDSHIGPGARLLAHCYLNQARVEADASIGPFAHLRPGADIGPGCKVGNFVEIKKSRMEEGAKASHLTYLGDAQVGAGANVGAGTITCNYDGKNKHRTTIGPGAFIGSNTALVAPISIGAGAYVGAGSTLTEDVPDRALGVARGRQRNIEGWAEPDPE
ncbi:UDP-N-acetylglucosamine diphosphorylase/glucosamine-1-phosphate N-acetyltransferase [Lujinxingia litoralis]|uniref:Bifunctional protein GlmU n=1 Tax=Lujinxingia litoralis TaxID=2211119 RepID=A0A328C802_9DELT|nr:bifunctional UDP-N-acetylglucosamine diphosphorylase/glucosamine-1-phosphate N-acetyltransferase GlmU [Lujinxingia litoralis]RAL23933.1 UDP-N-acetylglucosamine diphosphorylase/glucosamine-1-phosphate N-acetyltransferase [Lujinxingia litoralis]